MAQWASLFLQVKTYGANCLQSGSADTIGVNRVMALVWTIGIMMILIMKYIHADNVFIAILWTLTIQNENNMWKWRKIEIRVILLMTIYGKTVWIKGVFSMTLTLVTGDNRDIEVTVWAKSTRVLSFFSLVKSKQMMSMDRRGLIRKDTKWKKWQRVG